MCKDSIFISESAMVLYNLVGYVLLDTIDARWFGEGSASLLEVYLVFFNRIIDKYWAFP